MKRILAIFALIFGMSSAAQAGLLIEPYIGYAFGKATYTFIGATEYTDNLSGAGYGLRLGYKFLMPWVALDYTGGSGTAKSGRPGVADSDYTVTSLGGVVGVDLPILLRAWAGYGFSNEVLLKGAAGAADQKFKGTYTKVGVGFTGLPFVSLNAEYQIHDFKKVDVGSGEVDKTDVFDKLTGDQVLVSVSIPFDL
ncbi:MAG: outer membrane beta-barrel protein [Pseudobdellovibrionaceae bacterium]